jgi:hypothetical protein
MRAKASKIVKMGDMSNSPPPDGVDLPVDDRRVAHRRTRNSERRRVARSVISDELKAAARARSRGICECSNQNCWHFRKCKAPGVAYMTKRSAKGVISCVVFCRDCARTSGGRAERL